MKLKLKWRHNVKKYTYTETVANGRYQNLWLLQPIKVQYLQQSYRFEIPQKNAPIIVLSKTKENISRIS